MKKSETVISPAELKILEIVWDHSPISAHDIIHALEKSESWTDRTIKSLITRLLKKNAISYQQENNRYLYYPILKKKDYLKKATRSFISRFFGGKISPLVAHFSKIEKISKEEIKELKNILRELEKSD